MLGYGEEQGRGLTGSRMASRTWLVLLDPVGLRALVSVSKWGRSKWGVLCQSENTGLELLPKFFSIHEALISGGLYRDLWDFREHPSLPLGGGLVGSVLSGFDSSCL